MSKQIKDRKDYSNCTIYKENGITGTFELGEYDYFHNEYRAVNVETGEVEYFECGDLIGAWLL